MKQWGTSDLIRKSATQLQFQPNKRTNQFILQKRKLSKWVPKSLIVKKYSEIEQTTL